MTLGTTNITTTLVGSVLKIASRDIRGLCTASTINKWSFRKPIKIATTTAITDTDVWSVNGGFNIPIYTNPVILLNQKNSGANWEYVKPIGGSSSPYRIGDFRGYSHDATDWFEFLLYNNNILQGNTVTITLPSLTSLFNFDQFKLLSSNLRLGFIIAQNKSIGNTSINYYPVTGSSYPLILDLSELIMLPASLFSTVGTYYITPILTTANYPVNQLVTIREDNTLIGNWYAFDGDSLAANIVSVPVTNYISGDIDVIDIQIQGDGSYTIFELSTIVTNSYTQGITTNYTYSIRNEAGRENLNKTGSVYIPANSTVSIILIAGNGEDKQYPNGYNVSAIEPVLITTLAYNTQSRTNNIDLTTYT